MCIEVAVGEVLGVEVLHVISHVENMRDPVLPQPGEVGGVLAGAQEEGDLPALQAGGEGHPGGPDGPAGQGPPPPQGRRQLAHRPVVDWMAIVVVILAHSCALPLPPQQLILPGTPGQLGGAHLSIAPLLHFATVTVKQLH